MVELDGFSAVLFDLDGVLTSTAELHFQAWKETFDALLAHEPALPPDKTTFERDDYNRYVDGLPRQDGVRNFLMARGITVPQGSTDDPPDARTMAAIGRRKNDLVNLLITEKGVEVYEGSVAFLHEVRRRGLRTAVVSSSRNTPAVLDAAGITGLFDARVDGTVAAERELPGKPAPDTFLAAAADLGVDRADAVVFEDAIAGVASGKAGGFGFVVGVDRLDHADKLRAEGADVVVQDLEELL